MASVLYIVVSVLVATALANPIIFKDCGSVGAKVTLVDVGGCTKEPCHLVHNTNGTMRIDFTATENVAHPINAIYGIVAGVPIKFPVPEDCCANKNLQCPIKSGTSSTYNISIFISPEYPKVQVIVKLSILDDSKKPFLCIVFPAMVTDS